MATKFYTRYNHPDPVSPSGGVSLTDPQFVDECDVNKILKRFGATGELPRVSRSVVSGDFSDVGDFQSCLERINRAKDEFLSLPSDIRARFGNDPEAYVGFVLDPTNQDECIRLGLREKASVIETELDVLKDIKKAVTPKEDTSAK